MKALIYGRPGCTFCDKAKFLCKAQGIDFYYKIVGTDIQKEELEEMIGHPINSIPQIFVTTGGLTEYVGGFKELQSRLNEQLTQGDVLNG